MNKHEFMMRLYQALAVLTEQERGDILNDYEEHFRIGTEMGKSEEEIAESLGSPEELAASFTEDREAAAGPAPGTEEYGDDWYGQQNPFDQSAPQYREYNNPDEYADGYGVPGQEPAPEQGYPNAYPPSGYPRQRSSGTTAAYLVLLIFLTIFLIIPGGIPLFLGILAAIVAIAVSAGWFGISILVMYGASAPWLLAGIALLCLCACMCLCTITFAVGGAKLLAKYVRFFARVASGRKEATK